jgi:SAM-dependent methyltransferase
MTEQMGNQNMLEKTQKNISIVAHPCPLCGHSGPAEEAQPIRCNVRQYRERYFDVWRCAACKSLHCQPVDNLHEYYANYPVRNQKLDYFSRAWYKNILRRLLKAGLTCEHHIIDYGCNQGLFLKYLQEKGFKNCVGYDPYVAEYSNTSVLESKYDWVISLDVIEHDPDSKDFMQRLVALLKPSGRLCIETPNAEGIDLARPEHYLHALHVPYHVHILSQRALIDLAAQHRLRPMAVYNRWYMDGWLPGTSRNLVEGLLFYGDNDIDTGYESPRMGLFFKRPLLIIYLLVGFFIPSRKNDHMMLFFEKAL